MSSGPLISICIPAYNNEHFIGSTLESVLHQTCANFELSRMIIQLTGRFLS